jgi:hypothetical protein
VPTVLRAQQREHLVDAGDQHRPQLVCWALERHRPIMPGPACATIGCTGVAKAVTAALSGEFGASAPK